MSEELNPVAWESLASLPCAERMTADIVHDSIFDAYANQLMNDRQSVDLLTNTPRPGTGLLEPVHDTDHGAYGHFLFIPDEMGEKHYFYNLYLTRGSSGFTGYINEAMNRIVPLSVPQALQTIRRIELEFSWRTNSRHAVDLSEFHTRNIGSILNWMNSRGRAS